MLDLVMSVQDGRVPMMKLIVTASHSTSDKVSKLVIQLHLQLLSIRSPTVLEEERERDHLVVIGSILDTILSSRVHHSW